MDMWWLVANLFVAHLCGDFFLQCKGFCEKKRDENYRGWRVYVHAVCGKECTWILKEFLNGARESNPEIDVMPREY